MSDSSEQVEVLRLIWQELKDLGRNLGGRIDETNRRLDETNVRLDNVRTELKGEISGLRTELKSETSGLRTELKAEIGGLRSDLKADISDLRDDSSELRRAMAESHELLAIQVRALASEVGVLARMIVGPPDVRGHKLGRRIHEP